jgi:acylphosphatase
MPEAGPRRLDASVHGRVQGVGFRMYVADAAARLRISGWVANEAHGTVRCVAEGSKPSLDELLAVLRSGPVGARVERVDESWSTATGTFDSFRIRSGWHSGD